MSSSIKSTFIFFSLFFVVFGLLSLSYEMRIRKNDTYYQHYDYFAQETVQPEVLIFGDSRGVYGLRNSLLGDKIFNYSYFAENYAAHYLRLADAIQKKSSIKAILIPLDNHSIGAHRSHKDYGKSLYFSDFNIIRTQYPKSYLLDDLQGRIESIFPLLNRTEFTVFIKALAYDSKALITGSKRTRQRGFDHNLDLTVPNHKDWSMLNTQEQKSKARSNAKRKLANKGLSPDAFKAQKDVIALARSHGIKVYGIKFPVRPEYHLAATEYTDPEITSAYQALDLNGIFDFKKAFHVNPEFFEDADHLNQAGAMHFSAALRRQIHSKLHLRKAPENS